MRKTPRFPGNPNVSKDLPYFNHALVCASVCGCAYVSTGICGGQKRGDSPGAGGRAKLPAWVLGTYLMATIRVKSALDR